MIQKSTNPLGLWINEPDQNPAQYEPEYRANGPTAFAIVAFSIDTFCKRYGVGRTLAYGEIAAGRLRAIKVGRRTLITQKDADQWLAKRPAITVAVI